MTAWSFVRWIPLLGGIVSLTWPLRVPGITLPISIIVAVVVLAGWFTAGWRTVLVVQAVREDRVDPEAALAEWATWFPRAFVAGAFGIHRWRRWWFPVLLQMILLGWLTTISVSYSESPAPNEVTTMNTDTFHVNGLWTGGYENRCCWLEDLMEAVDAPPLPLVVLLLGLMFTVLAVVVKLRITACLDEPAAPPPDGPAAAASGP